MFNLHFELDAKFLLEMFDLYFISLNLEKIGLHMQIVPNTLKCILESELSALSLKF